MSTGSIERFQILGYFSRIFARRSASTRELISKVRRSQGEAFKALCTACKTFSRAKTHDHSKALAKQIVQVAVMQEEESLKNSCYSNCCANCRPLWDGANKTRQLANVVLSNWLRDGKRNTLEADIRAELRIQLSAFHEKFDRPATR